MQNTEQIFQRCFIVVVICVVFTVIVSMGPVWLSAEATRAAQHSQHLKDEITQTLQVSERLEMQRAAITNELRLNQSVMADLGMVRTGGEISYIELNDIIPNTGATAMGTQVSIQSDSVANLASANLEARQANDMGVNIADASGHSAQQTASNGNGLGQMLLSVVDTMAQLTAGEASTLLVGDVGLVGLR